ncbi:UNKNOWN [Stylonychia lemnae]|uniref:Prefoldin subunit 4 n=1 Tax=Stylonychia lemnae TaxID=5949 RepID=A0A078BE73_STYLE|nr:UNKNOWN [Stylonychia lemnae]|eukprot:CDW91858.1 UNKNOWN [Stylonychia lemnae]
MSVKVTRQDTEISREDQQKINAFSKLNMRSHEYRKDIKALKEKLDALQDAEQMIEESFGEGLKLQIGEALIDVDEETATKYQQKIMEETQEELEKLQDQLDEIENEMKNLKSYLYARFGTAINLEEE